MLPPTRSLFLGRLKVLGLQTLFRLDARYPTCAALLRRQRSRKNVMLSDESVVTSRPPVTDEADCIPAKGGRIAAPVRQNELRAPCPPWSKGRYSDAARPSANNFSLTSDCATRPGPVGPDSSRAPEAQCSHRRTRKAPKLQVRVPTTWQHRSFDPTLDYSGEKRTLLAAPLLFSSWSLSSLFVDNVAFNSAEHYMMAEKCWAFTGPLRSGVQYVLAKPTFA